MRRTEYLIASEKSITDLETAVDRLILDGWECQGGLSVEVDVRSNYLVYHQAMVRHEPVGDLK